MEELITVLRGIQTDISLLIIVLVLLLAVILLKPMGGSGKK